MPNTNTVTRLADADRHLRKFSQTLIDWTPFWRELAEHLADTAQQRWALRRRTGKLRKSLTWAGSGLGPRGVFEASPDRLTFGTGLFYARFAHYGTRKQARTPLIHVDEADASNRLNAWVKARAEASGLEVDGR